MLSLRLLSRQTVQSVRRFATYKTSTGLVGLQVDPNGRETLIQLCSDRFPECGYRTETEQWFNFINRVCMNNTDIKKIEDEIELGQIEEVIEMAKDELVLIDYYYDNKGWELVERAKLRADEMAERLQDNFVFTMGEEQPPAAEAPKK